MNIDNKELMHFTESFSCSRKTLIAASQEELQESLSRAPGRLQESVSEVNEDGTVKGYWVPISFYNKKNLNKRIYNKKLWDNVINKQRATYVGSPMLADHPQGDSDGNPKDICGVWLDGKVGEPGPDGVGMVYGLLVPSGTLGRDLMDHLKNGLRIGTSSSGFGRLLPDGVTVDPDTYIIERLGDCVLAPSQSTYFSYDEGSHDMVDSSIKESTEKVITAEAVKESTVSEVETNTNINSVDFMEKAVSDHKFTKLEEKRFRRDMLSFLEDAEKNIKDPQKRLEEFRNIESFLEDGACPDLKESIEKKIKEEEEFIRTAIAEKIELRDDLKINDTKELKEKIATVVNGANLSDQEAKDWKKVAEALQAKLLKAADALKSAEAELKIRPTAKYAEALESTCKELKEAKEAAEKIQAEICTKYLARAMESEKRAVAAEDQVNHLKEEVDYLQGGTVASIRGLKTLQESVNNLKAENAELKEANAKLEKANAVYQESIESQRKELEEAVNRHTKADNIIRSYRRANAELQKNLDVEATKKARAAEKINEAAEKKAMSPQEAFYAEKAAKYGDLVEPFKEKICNAKSMPEAKNIFFTQVLSSDSAESMVESVEVADKLTESFTDKSESLGNIIKNRTGWL